MTANLSSFVLYKCIWSLLARGLLITEDKKAWPAAKVAVEILKSSPRGLSNVSVSCDL